MTLRYFNTYSIAGVLAALCLCLFSSCGASKDEKLMKLYEREGAISQIELLQETAILIRINTSAKAIQHLMSHNEFGKARVVRQKAESYNTDLIEAFEKEFDFCEVYFYPSNQTVTLKNRDYTNLQITDFYLDTIMNPDFLNEGFLIGEMNHGSSLTGITIKDSNFQPIDFGFRYPLKFEGFDTSYDGKARKRKLKDQVKDLNRYFKHIYKMTRKERREINAKIEKLENEEG